MKIINHTANGNFNALDLPTSYGGFRIQARTAVNIDVRRVGETDYWTLKSGTSESLPASLAGKGVEVRAANGTIIEILLGFPSR